MFPFPQAMLCASGATYKLVQVGSLSGNSLSAVTHGYQINATNNPGGSSVFWYYNRDMLAQSQTKFYWEVDSFQANDDALWGVVGSTAPVAYLGYSGANAGVYNFSNSPPWSQWGSWAPSSFATQTSGVAGFAFDAAAKTLGVFLNGSLKTTLTMGSLGPSSLYAAVTWQANTPLTNTIRLGAGNTVYAPPAGYDYL